MAADGKITFSTELDNSGVQKDLNAAKREIEKATKSLEESKSAKFPLVEQAEKLGPLLDGAKAKLAELQKQQTAAAEAMSGSDPSAYIESYAQKPELDTAVIEQTKQVNRLQKEWDAVNDKIDHYDSKIARANATIAEQKQRAGELSTRLMSGASAAKATGVASADAATNTSAMALAVQKASSAAAKFQKRMTGIVKRVLLFSLVSKALYAAVEHIGKALKTNKEFTAQLAELKGALLTAFQPLYEALLPVLIALLRIATSVAQVIAHVFSLLGGKSASKYAKSAKALYDEANAVNEVGKAAKKTQRDLAGFDEINRIGGSTEEDSASVSTSTAVTPDFSAFDTAEYQEKIHELTLIVAGALLALGAILAFSGANIPLGIGLMAAGAIGLATEIVANWDAISNALRGPIGTITAIASGALLVLGLILAFSGCSIPLGIGLIIAGAAGLATTATANWDTIVNQLRGPVGGITAIASGALLVLGLVLAFSGTAIPLGIGLIVAGAAGLAATATVNWDSIVTALQGPIGMITAIAGAAALALGIILVCTGVGIPLGIALIAAGAAGLVTTAAVNWGVIKDKVVGVWNSIVQWWQTAVAPKLTKEYWINKIFSGISKALPDSWKPGINKVIAMINSFIRWVNNKLSFKFDGFSIAGKQIIPPGEIKLVNLPEIPYLAQGAVIPPNREFMAVLGDQKHGTNIEAPLSTIQEAVAAVMDDYAMANLAGHEATVAVLREILEAILGIEIGDSVIGEAVARYNRKMAIMRGGV